MSKYFSKKELSCKCDRCVDNIGNGIAPRLYGVLDAIRDVIGQPITVLSGYRCPEHNDEVGGVPNSQHVLGTAADLTYNDIDVDYLAEVAEQCGADGIGKYPEQGFVHVDVRGEYSRWEG